jgi:hypothetical protein
MNVYTDPKMLDVARAVAAVPALPAVTGAPDRIAPEIAPTSCNPERNTGNDQTGIELSEAAEVIVRSALPDNTKGPLTVLVNEPLGVGATGLEPVTPSVSC